MWGAADLGIVDTLGIRAFDLAVVGRFFRLLSA
jgi:hypothetical protein